MLMHDAVIESIASPGFLVGRNGDLLRINRHGYTLLERALHVNKILNIRELDTNFDPDMGMERARVLTIGKLRLTAHIYPCYERADQDEAAPAGVLYVIDSVLFNTDFVNLMNALDDIVTITNSEGIIEFVSNASFPMTGEHYGIGTDTHDMKGRQILNNPVTLDVLEKRKPVVSRVAYRSGSTLLNRAYPLFGANGDIDKIIILALNATSLLLMDESLFARELQDHGHQIELEELSRMLQHEDIVAVSTAMRRVFLMAHRVAPSDASVFIQGESGVGKEIVASFIHRSGKRGQGPFISVNCSAIPGELFEAEMFGYERGAFTGAGSQGKAGLLELASGGTIFLDEIGELPLVMQSKLLRAIQEKKIRRIGGTADIDIDVRYISATNMSMEKVLDTAYFRQDLYYRLSVVQVVIPPLRERREDIIPLVSHYLAHYNTKAFGKDGRNHIRISKAELRKLLYYDWPGNTRELCNVIERFVLLAEDRLLREIPEELLTQGPKKPRDDLPESHDSPDQPGPPEEAAPPRRQKVDDARITEACRMCGSVHKAARRLGIAPSTIYRKIKAGKVRLQRAWPER